MNLSKESLSMNKESHSFVIFCHYFKQELPALDKPPVPGELGQLIHSHISAKAWELWVIEQVKFINEHQLELNRPEHRERIKAHRFQYLKLDSLEFDA